MQTPIENGNGSKRCRSCEIVTREKIQGMFLGIAIGDALGMPFESKSYEEMQFIPRIEDYLSSRRAARGTYTDDTQLTISVAEAILESGGIDMNSIANHHVIAYKKSTSGWGGTTREAVQKIALGSHWSESGNFNGATNRGYGNGIPMKIAPLAAYFAMTKKYADAHKIIVDFTKMTHQTSVAVSSAFAHNYAIYDCLTTIPDDFNVKSFVDKLSLVSEAGKRYYPETFIDDLSERFKVLSRLLDVPDLLFNVKYLVEEFGRGTCYVYNSLPLAYAFFIRAPRSIESMYDVIHAGGDVDTNASFVGGLLGALSGVDIFPAHLIDGLKQKSEILSLADKFYDKFNLQSANLL